MSFHYACCVLELRRERLAKRVASLPPCDAEIASELAHEKESLIGLIAELGEAIDALESASSSVPPTGQVRR
jgi:hypothetical protein